MTPYHMLLDCCNGLWHLTSVVFALSDKAQTWNHNMLGSEDKGRNLAKLMEVDITEQCLGQTWGMQESCNRGATALNRGIVSASCDSRDHSRTDERATIGLDFMHFVVGVVSTWSGLSPLTWSMSKQYFDLPRSVFFSPLIRFTVFFTVFGCQVGLWNHRVRVALCPRQSCGGCSAPTGGWQGKRGRGNCPCSLCADSDP